MKAATAIVTRLKKEPTKKRTCLTGFRHTKEMKRDEMGPKEMRVQPANRRKVILVKTSPIQSLSHVVSETDLLHNSKSFQNVTHRMNKGKTIIEKIAEF